jgi:hypothetical protein
MQPSLHAASDDARVNPLLQRPRPSPTRGFLRFDRSVRSANLSGMPRAERRVEWMRGLHRATEWGEFVSAADGGDPTEISKSMAWLEVAAKLPGKSMHLAVVLLHLAADSQSDRVMLSNRTCLRFGLDRNAKYRALLSLEGAGLVRVQRTLGRSPVVEIVGSAGAP